MFRQLAALAVVVALCAGSASANGQERFPGLRRFWPQWLDPLDLFEKPATYRYRMEPLPLPVPVPGPPSEKTLV